MAKVRDRVRRWWEGTYEPYDNEPGSSLVMLCGEYRRHWTAVAARACWSYFREHHRWIIGTAVAIAAVVVALKAGRP